MVQHLQGLSHREVCPLRTLRAASAVGGLRGSHRAEAWELVWAHLGGYAAEQESRASVRGMAAGGCDRGGVGGIAREAFSLSIPQAQGGQADAPSVKSGIGGIEMSKTVHQRIMIAAERGTGLRLTAEEVSRLSLDQAIEQCAMNDDADEAERLAEDEQERPNGYLMGTIGAETR
jgi:hypothetical protein